MISRDFKSAVLVWQSLSIDFSPQILDTLTSYETFK